MFFVNKKIHLDSTRKERKEYFMSTGGLKLSSISLEISFVPSKYQVACVLTIVQKG